ncbi:MAG: hypothetical protein ACE5GV_00495 [Candidatus Scalindua sp.]
MPAIAEIVIFGIKAGIRLGQQGRQAYVEGTIERELVLPLPNFNSKISLGSAMVYFRGGGKVHLEDNKHLKDLFDDADSGNTLKNDEQDELIFAYREIKLIDDVKSGTITGQEKGLQEKGLSKEALLSLLTVRQWARGNSPFPSALQRVLGALIEIGVDYYANTPGAIDEKSSSGRALKGFLKSIDGLNFAEERVEEIAKSLFIAAVETIGENIELLGADDKTERLVEVVAKGLVKDVRERTDALAGKDLSKQEKIHGWAQLIFRSVLSNAGKTVLANPKSYLGIDDKSRQAMVSSVGTSILDLIIDEDSIDLSELFSREGIDKVVKTALTTLSENPSLMGIDHKGLNQLLTQVAKDLAESSKIIGPDILPDIMRLVLEKSAQNADLLWPVEFRNDPGKHLLITASKELLGKLSKISEDGEGWKPRLSKTQILEVFEVVLDEVVQNPEWLVESASGTNLILGETVESAITALRSVPSGRLNAETGVKVLKGVIKAVGLRKEFLDKISVDGEQKKAISAALETIVDATLSDSVDPKALWTLARGEVFGILTSTALTKLIETGISEDTLNKLKEVLNETIEDLKSGKPWHIDSLIENINKLTA